MMPNNAVVNAARRYWRLREAGDKSDRRVAAHNALLDAMTAAQIPFEDRDHAALLARELLHTTPRERRITVRFAEPELHRQFKTWCVQREISMESVAMTLIQLFLETPAIQDRVLNQHRLAA